MEFDDPSRPSASWQGASVSFVFEGTDAEVTFDPGSRTEYFRVILNDDHLGSRRFAASPGSASHTLAEGLEPGTHKIQLVKETYMGTQWELQELEIHGSGLLEAPAEASRHIAFYGDSIWPATPS